ncbi:UNVERIFIED_CONTAM: hypothetical protein NCL1_51053 [Trichonephila clavipes]
MNSTTLLFIYCLYHEPVPLLLVVCGVHLDICGDWNLVRLLHSISGTDWTLRCVLGLGGGLRSCGLGGQEPMVNCRVPTVKKDDSYWFVSFWTLGENCLIGIRRIKLLN